MADNEIDGRYNTGEFSHFELTDMEHASDVLLAVYIGPFFEIATSSIVWLFDAWDTSDAQSMPTFTYVEYTSVAEEEDVLGNITTIVKIT